MSDIRMPRRQRNRMAEYDYTTPGAYFVTSCTDMRLPVFGYVENKVMLLSPVGKIVDESLGNLGRFIQGIKVSGWVVMPNHVHAIIQLEGPAYPDAFVGNKGASSLPNIMQRFKSYTGNMFQKGVAGGLWAGISKNLWQRSYHDIILNSERDERRLEKYMTHNPASWERDKLNPNWKILAPRKV